MKLQQKLAAVGGAVSGLVVSASSAMAVDLQELKVTPGKGFATSPNSYINTIVQVVFVVGALLALAYLIVGGIQWITAAGDKSKTEGARNHITAALIGMLILAGAFAIFNVIMSVIGAGDAASNPFSLITPLT